MTKAELKAELLEEKIKSQNRRYSDIIAFRVLGVIFLIILVVAVLLYYINNVQPYSCVKSCYRRNEEQFNVIVSYFDELKADYENICAVYMDINGKIEIHEYIPDNKDRTTNYEDCSSDSGYIALSELNDKYPKYQFHYAYVVYDKNGNMKIEIPVYYQSYSKMDGLLYYLVYYDDDYALNDLMSNSGEDHSINDNWFIYSKKASIG